MQHKLSRRERQIMDIVYEKGHVTTQEVLDALPDPPGYSAVRALMRILEEKGHLTHQQEGSRYVFSALEARQNVASTALQNVVKTFFGGNPAEAAATLLSNKEAKISREDLDRLAALVEEARRSEEA